MRPAPGFVRQAGAGMTSGTARRPLDVGFAHLLGFSEQESGLKIE